MKNVLLTTTVLVAVAGAASADIGWGGSASMEYNSLATPGFTYGADLTVTGTADLDNGVTASLSYGIALDGAGAITGDTYPVITLESGMGKLSGGDADAVGGAAGAFADHGAAASTSQFPKS